MSAQLNTTDPFVNLAVEEFLFDTLPPETRLLLLYVNEPAVVLGKHQNPWLEVNLRELEKRSLPLVRRISGGGTVYHDGGNLNFSFLGPKRGFDRGENLELIQKGLASFGISVDMTDLFDLYLGDKKISGNAFCFRRDKALHHGTLLLNADLESLHGLLTPPDISIETHAVRSRPVPTANIAPHGVFAAEDIANVMSERFSAGEKLPVGGLRAHPTVLELAQRNRTWEWTFGKTPKFVITLDADIKVTVVKGCIDTVDGLEAYEAEPLLQMPFSRSDLDTIRQEPGISAKAGELARTLAEFTI